MITEKVKVTAGLFKICPTGHQYKYFYLGTFCIIKM